MGCRDLSTLPSHQWESQNTSLPEGVVKNDCAHQVEVGVSCAAMSGRALLEVLVPSNAGHWAQGWGYGEEGSSWASPLTGTEEACLLPVYRHLNMLMK